MLRRIGICLGDASGIGPEVALKAIAAEPPGRDVAYRIIGALGDLFGVDALENPALALNWEPGPLRAGETQVIEPSPRFLARPLPGDAKAAQAAVCWLQVGAEACLSGELDALVTAPVNKHAIAAAGIPFIGQTEFLAGMAGTRRTAMMLLGTDDAGRWLRVALATTHLPLRRVPDAVTEAGVRQTIELAAESCRLLGLPSARVAVCGLNPHAGENGDFGHEDADIIAPAVAAACCAGLDASGPWPADTVFRQALHGEFEVVVAMYHDQGLAPLKLVAFDTGVNWTLGLPFIRTSPDHGTAYDIAWRGIANPSSMISALRLAKQLAVASPPSAARLTIPSPV